MPSTKPDKDTTFKKLSRKLSFNSTKLKNSFSFKRPSQSGSSTKTGEQSPDEMSLGLETRRSDSEKPDDLQSQDLESQASSSKLLEAASLEPAKSPFVETEGKDGDMHPAMVDADTMSALAKVMALPQTPEPIAKVPTTVTSVQASAQVEAEKDAGTTPDLQIVEAKSVGEQGGSRTRQKTPLKWAIATSVFVLAFALGARRMRE